VRALASVCLVAACCGLVGCSIFGKKPKDRADAPAQQPADRGWPGSTQPTDRSSTDRRGPGELSGILAGRVVDSYDNHPPRTYIQVIPAGNSKENTGAPIEKEVDAQGYFAITDLKPGQRYHLIARTGEGDRKLAGEAWTTTPNPRLLIRMSEDFATENTPAAPRPPSIPGQKAAPKSDMEKETPKTPNSIPPQRDADIGKPIKISEQAATPPATVSPKRAELPGSLRPEDIAAESGNLAGGPPVANIPGTRSSPAPGDTGAQAIPPVATRVPSCVLTGLLLDNFALNDLDGQPWEYRNRRGRITLLDFWATSCLPCRQAIPSLKILQERYGRYGLEIVGIAYEEGSPSEQVRKVQNVRDILGIKYRLLLGSDITMCPVRTQFGVNNFPTLVLIDERSRIIWRKEGLDSYRIQELEMLIIQQLHLR
jgi:thiol-disulfide isomerase/thioredoxin